jgi:branched-chain amino acid transport system permease protein
VSVLTRRQGTTVAAAGRWVRAGALAVLLALGAVFPLMFNNQLTTYYAVLTLIYTGGVVGWNLFSGYSGYISLGHAVFFGVGAYTVGLLALHQNLDSSIIFATLPLGGLAGAVVAVPFGLFALRVRRHTFVVVTIAVFFIFQLMAFNLSFTNGNGGLSPPFLNWDPNTVYNPFYYAAFIIAAGAVLLSWLIRGSRFGLQLLAIRDDEDRARGLGVRAMRVKLTAFVISAFINGVVGGLWIFFIGQALPETAFDPTYDLTIALMGFLGGFGTLWGPVLGALILEPLQQQITQRFTAVYLGEILLGGLFLLVILFLPRGLLPTGREWVTALRARWQRRQQPSAAPAQNAGHATGPPEGTAAAGADQGSGHGSVAAAGHSGVPGTGGTR